MLQTNNMDFMNPIQIQFTYDLSNVGEPSMVSGTGLPDINNYPVVNKAKTEKNFSVSSSVLFCDSVNLIDSVGSVSIILLMSAVFRCRMIV